MKRINFITRHPCEYKAIKTKIKVKETQSPLNQPKMILKICIMLNHQYSLITIKYRNSL
jgi:hypothetical protein